MDIVRQAGFDWLKFWNKNSFETQIHVYLKQNVFVDVWKIPLSEFL